MFKWCVIYDEIGFDLMDVFRLESKVVVLE